MSQRTIVELDLVGYSDLARDLEQQVGVEVVARFNDQIQEFVDVGLAAIHSTREDVVRATTGDGAILVFNRAVDAHEFAVVVLKATRTHNAQKSLPSAERWFRVGIATGEMHERTRPNGTPEIAGTVIANAVRLESAARPGQIVMDSATFALLPKESQAFYDGEEIVEGKRSERFVARRYTVVGFETQRPPTGMCPYVGLRAFREEDAAFYAGRTAFVEKLVGHVADRGSVIGVVGPSGSGKSSVVMAGLIPELRKRRPPNPTWDALVFKPGRYPWRSLADAFGTTP
jgi:class 3 adenylate cyclase